jgi:hypothetical protein
VTVIADALRPTAEGTYSRKWTHTPAFVVVPKVSLSSANEARAPIAVHNR